MSRSLAPIFVASITAATVAAVASADEGVRERPTPPLVTCETRIQVVPSRGDSLTRKARRHAVKIGRVFLLGARDLADLPRSDFEPRHGATAPVKSPFVVRSGGPPFTISVALRSRAKADVEVGLDQGPYRFRADAMTLEPCAPDAEVAGREVGPRTPFNGGFRVSGPQCLRLRVQADNQEAPARGRVALGRRSCR